MKKDNLDFLFNPASVAVVGASPEAGKLSGIIIESIKNAGFKGAIFPVNPKHDSINGLKCYPAISAIDAEVHLAVFAVPARPAVGLLREAIGRIKGAIIISGGFGEVDDAGKSFEKDIKDIVRRFGIRVVGPNCLGIFDTCSGLDTFFIPNDRLKRPAKGPLSIISQSGSFAVTAMDELAQEGIGVARIVSYGNRVDINESDCLEFLANDPDTGIVALYIESVDDGRRFIEAAKKCSSKKPVLAVKVGKMDAGASAAHSHTGAMTGRYEVYRAAFRKSGITEVSGYEELIEGCRALSLQKPSKGTRVMIITDGGGMGVNIADAASAAGLQVPPLDESIREDLSGSFPPFFIASNPMDLTGSVTDELFAEALEKAMSKDFYDIAIVAALWGPPGLTDNLVGLLSEKSLGSGKPVVICSPGGNFARGKDHLFKKNNLPVYTTPEATVRAASVLARIGATREK